MNLPDVGVVIARFQCPQLTLAHRALLDYVQVEHPGRVLILLGVSPSGPTERNPLDYMTREMMVAQAYPNALILPLEDCRTNKVWSKAVDEAIASAFGNSPAILYGGRDSFIPYYEGKHITCEYYSTMPELSGTADRKEAASIPQDNESFRRGVIYGVTNQFPRIYPTVDVALVRTHTHDMRPELTILLGRKPNEQLFRLPGGFTDMADTSLEMAARRELREETGLGSEGRYVCLGSFRMQDWRHRWCKDVGVMTSLFTAPYTFGAATASDDLQEVKWFPLNADLAAQVVEEHRPLIEAVLSYWTKEQNNAR